LNLKRGCQFLTGWGFHLHQAHANVLVSLRPHSFENHIGTGSVILQVSGVLQEQSAADHLARIHVWKWLTFPAGIELDQKFARAKLGGKQVPLDLHDYRARPAVAIRVPPIPHVNEDRVFKPLLRANLPTNLSRDAAIVPTCGRQVELVVCARVLCSDI
jgi:hypothetical protein